MIYTPHPETPTLLKEWNDARLEMLEAQDDIEELQVRIRWLQEKMDNIPFRLESTLVGLSQPIGMRINDDYVVVTQNPSNDFVVQTVDFNLREETIDS